MVIGGRDLGHAVVEHGFHAETICQTPALVGMRAIAGFGAVKETSAYAIHNPTGRVADPVNSCCRQRTQRAARKRKFPSSIRTPSVVTRLTPRVTQVEGIRDER